MDSVTVSPTSVKNTDGKGLLEPRAKLEAHVGYCGCRKKAVKAEARPSQDLKVSPTYSFLPASLYGIPDGCPALSPALERFSLEQGKRGACLCGHTW